MEEDLVRMATVRAKVYGEKACAAVTAFLKGE